MPLKRGIYKTYFCLEYLDHKNFLHIFGVIVHNYGIMRKNIAWTERDEDNEKREIRVIFNGGDNLLWRWSNRFSEGWQPLEPTAELWEELLRRAQARYVRRQTPYKDVQLIERLAAGAKRK